MDVDRRTLLLATAAVALSPALTATASTGDPVSRMTLEEKVSLLHGATDPASLGQAGYLPGVPRLGIPEVRLTDGPAGIRVTRPATALPAPVALAATFDPATARDYGRVLGEEGRSLGQDVLLAPMTNIVRVPQAGRNFETLGEDPLLAGALVAAEVRGIQEAGLIATVKHYAANNFENGRQTVSADVDERTLREIYLPAFEAAVRAGAGAVMASYNRVNGVYASENAHLLTEILRGDWGFRGFVMSDWGATHSMEAILAGLDMEMPGGTYFAALVTAVREGRIPESVVDTATRRVVTQLRRFGAPKTRPPLDRAGHARAARRFAAAGAVLLRNENAVLPLTGLRSVAVIGPTARSPLVGGGGSAHVVPEFAESPLDALARRAGRPLPYAPGVDLDGVPVPASALSTGTIDFTGSAALPAGTTRTWTGTLTAPETGDYDLRIQGSGAVQSFQGGISLTLDGTRIGSVGAIFGGNSRLLATGDGLGNAGTVVHLEAGQPHQFTITATGAADTPLQVRLAWVTPARRRQALDEAVALASSARTVLLFAFNEGTEGQDRPGLALPDNQDPVVAAVAAANPRTVVVLNTGDPVTMPWLDRTAAVLQMWYPGQEGADATAALLLGEANPGGKLPVTYPKREADAPTAPPERYPGVNGHAQYSEGIFVGYRHYDAHDVEPLFPFGHGLSYTRFHYSDLSVRGRQVEFLLRNTGDRAGAEVAQVYLGPPASVPVPMARQLAAFARVELRPGESRRIRLELPGRALSYWSGGWRVVPGDREVQVGSSSRDIRLNRTVFVH
ncbi:glycoside hydrolase family 3 C-terminal domain-containing protein [Amycolatopsis sacchari]|uniref:glycoside hydrolase family 3 C-terminal domain-containing protein n=1 Tax=Amycolatopsis sacchari TaxID=115433 RepID=UPI003D71FC98